MKKLEYAIQKDEGLHMKEAVEFVDMTEEFRSEIEVEERSADGEWEKSIGDHQSDRTQGRQTLRYCPRRR